MALTDLDGDGELDLAVFEGVAVGSARRGRPRQSAALVEPGNAVGLLVYENTWAGPFVSAAAERRGRGHRQRPDPGRRGHRGARGARGRATPA